MGNSNELPEGHSKFLNQYGDPKRVNDYRYGLITLYADKRDPTKMVALKEKWIRNEQENHAFSTEIGHKSRLNCQTKAKIVYHWQKFEEQFCSSFWKHNIFHEWNNKS